MTSRRATLLLLIFGLCWLFVGTPAVIAAGQPIMQVLAQDPPEGTTIAVGDRLFLRVGYRSDVPVRFQAEGYRQGLRQETSFVNSAPPYDAGEGEALVWIGFPVAVRIDQINLTAYDVEWQKLGELPLPMVITWEEEDENAAPRAAAAWVGPLQKHHRHVFDTALDPLPQRPDPFFDVFLLVAVISIPFYVLLQVRMMVSYHGGWRKYAAVPLLAILPLCLYSLFGLGIGANYWVVFLTRFFPVALAYLLVIRLIRWLRDQPGAGETAP